LRKALAWLLFGALVPLLVASSFFLWRQWDLQRDASFNRLQDLSLSVQLAVDRELALDQTALQVLATSGAIDAQDWGGFYGAAIEATKVRPGTWVLMGNRAHQTIINTSVRFGSALPTFGDTEPGSRNAVEWQGRKLPPMDGAVLSEPLFSGRPRVSNLFYGPVRKGPVVALSVPVKRNGAVAYSLAFAYGPERFLDVLRQQPGADKVVISIIDGNGNIIVRSRNPEQSIGHVAPWHFARGRDASDDTPVIEAQTLEGVPAFFAHRHSDASDWTVAIGMPRQDVLAPARHSLAVWLPLLLAMIAGAALLAHRFWRSVAIPLTALAIQAREPRDHDIDMPPSDIEEVVTLCTALKDARGAERARREEVSRRLELEHRERVLASTHAEELRAADRRKDEFLAIVAHELRNPLAPITNSLTLLRSIGSRDPTLQRLLPILDRQVRQLARLVEDLLDLARIGSRKIMLTKRRLDIREIAEQAAQAAQPAMEARGHAFTVQCAGEPLHVDADEARLAQILGNLMDNAAKYTDPGGHIVLSASREGEKVVVQVADDGKGIPAQLLPHVFDLFEQGDLKRVRAAGGLGIGLHVVKRLVEQHGGEIGVESAGEHRGSVFTLKLPLADGTGTPKPLEGGAARCAQCDS
jgi:signal transduction histidine kinase